MIKYLTDNYGPIKTVDSFNQYELIGYKNEYEDNLFFRSVAVDVTADKIVSFSPPKSIPYLSNMNLADCHVEEMIEGTMINVFWCKYLNHWIPCTRRRIGAENHFFKECSKSFYELFYDAVQALNISFDNIPTNLSFTFVLQHPDNRIVTKFTTPNLYLIDVFEYSENDTIPKKWSHPLNTTGLFENVSYPIIFSFDTSAALETYVNSQPYSFMGVAIYTIHDPNMWQRMKVINTSYQYVKNLRGNQCDLLYRYIQLKREKQIRKFITVFSEFVPQFDSFKQAYEAVVARLYQNQHHTYLLRFYEKKTMNAIKAHLNQKNIKKNQIYLYIAHLDETIQFKLLKEFQTAIQTPSLSQPEPQCSS